MTEPPTRIACLTPPGRAAIATLTVRGPAAWRATRELFRPAGPAPLPEAPEEGRFWLGWLGSELRDEVVLAVHRGPPEPVIEIHCHGGPEVVRLLEEAYARQGAIACPWQDLPDIGPDVLPWLAQAPTVRTAAILLDQYQGAFARALAEVHARLGRGEVDAARAALDRLAGLLPLGAHLTAPWRVVLAGAPNAGKSSLVNALAGYTRSLVAPTAGTTRDVVAATLAIDGWPVEVIDTAGLRDAAAGLERAGIARARRAIAAADVRLWVLDGAADPVFPPAGEEGWRLVINKADLPPAWDHTRAAGALVVSARTRAGLDALCQALAGWLVPAPPAPGEAVPCTPQDRAAVRAAAARLPPPGPPLAG